jgi:hypothetical protein
MVTARSCTARIDQMSFYEYAHAQTFIQLAHQNQITVRGHSRALEIDLQRAIEQELNWPILCLTYRLSTFACLTVSKPTPISAFRAVY